MLPVVSRTGIAAARSLGYYVVVMVIVSVVQILSLYPVAAAIGRVPVIRFAQAVFAPQAIALTSSSSLASLPALLDWQPQIAATIERHRDGTSACGIDL
jgi:proton glutamate symport protein